MAAAGARRSRLYRLGGASRTAVAGIVRSLVWPKIDLVIRLWLAGLFFASGVLKLTHWQTALDLARNEYPVSWLGPVAAAYTGVTIEVVGAVLLAAGFMTRYAAVPLLILSLVIQFAYLPFDSQLFWAVLFAWYAVHGAGPLSLDGLLRRGLADSALPLVPRLVRAGEWLRATLTPACLSLIRLYLAVPLLMLGLRSPLFAGEAHAFWSQWFPLGTLASVPAPMAVAGGALLVAGLATRYASVALILSLSVGVMVDPRLTDTAYLLMLLALLAAFGGGVLSADALLARLLAARRSRAATRTAGDEQHVARVVIIGAGFGGISCAAALKDAGVQVTLIDRANHHLFQPLLYQVATAGLSPGDIATPVRTLFRGADRVRVLLGTVTGIDAQAQRVQIEGQQVPYDFLVVATGAAHSYFGKDQWAPHAPGLKRIEDATEIRRRILTAFEHAEATQDAAERAALLTFLVVGGGPTGVELAGAIAELARFGMEKDFRTFDPAQARVVLVQSAPRLLPAFPEKLAAIAQQSLEKLGVEVKVGSRVEQIDALGVAVSGQRIAARTVLWAAGVKASAAAQWLGVEADSAGRVKVGPDLTVPGFANIYVIGDTALSNAWKGQAVPGLAPAAKQGGHYAARHIRARLRGATMPEPFRYRHFGSLATIGRKAAVADFGAVTLWGAPAWWLWGLLHVGFLVGLRNRLATMVNWFWAYLTFGGGIRLITGAAPATPPAAASPPVVQSSAA
jgi:NADH dehydrogenase/putative oxidoreductase